MQRESERRALDKVPRLVRLHPVPATGVSPAQQEVDDGERGALSAAIVRLDAGTCPKDFTIEASFGMRLQLELPDQIVATHAET